MSCQKIQPLLPLLSGGDLDGRQREVALSHLEGCVSCRTRLSELQALRGILASAPDPGFTEAERLALRRDVLRAIRVEAESRDETLSERFRRLLGGLFHPLLAAAATLLVVVLLALQRRTAEPRRPDTVTLVEARPTTVAGQVASPATPGQKTSASTLATTVPELFPRHAPVTVVTRRRKPRREAGAVPFGSPPPAGGPSRIEIQTSDPNVRIIWLAPQQPEAAEDETTSS